MKQFHFVRDIEKAIKSIDPSTPSDLDHPSATAGEIREVKRILKMLGERIVYDGQ